jgi:hypothetical protein
MIIEPRRGYNWDGSSKIITKDCVGCEWYKEIRGKALCGWGVSFKLLEDTENKRRCEIRNRKVNGEHSLYYLIKIEQNELLGAKHAMD